MELARHPHLKPLLTTLVNVPPPRLESLSVEELASALDVSPRTVQRKLKKLTALGAIRLTRPHGGRGAKYHFLLHPACYYIAR